MRDYEALIIVKAAGTEQEMGRQATGLEEPIKKVGGSVESNQPMGRRRLAFRIARQTEGHYFLLRFRAPTAQVGELDRLYRLNESVVRFMILSAEEVSGPPPAPEPSTPALAKAGSAPPSARRR